ncbi:hypothetical protein [Nocardioides pakistanensis]
MSKNQPSQAASAVATNRSVEPAADRHARSSSAARNSKKSRLRVISGSPQDPRQFAAEVLLIRNWLDIIRRCAMATAHGTLGGQLPDVEELLAVLEAAEEAIAARILGGASLLDHLAGWEASLLHHAPGIQPDDCLVCERGREIPDDLPADYAWALRVIDEAS